jgi:small basic protein
MEFIFELLFEIFGELLLQIVLELLFELGLRSVQQPFKNPLLGGIGYALFGAIAGGLSLWWFPQLFITSHAGRIANVIVTPLLSGLAMAALGAWRRRREQPTILLDRFAYAFIFAMAMALVRLRFGGV